MVLGPVAPEDLGLTLMHEHVAFDCYVRPERPGHYDWDEVAAAAGDELAALRATQGVRTLVEMTTIGNERSPEGLAEVARRSGLNIVACTGFWMEPPLKELVGSDDVEALADLMAREVSEGMEGTAIRAGIIKVSTSERITPVEERVARAAARASRRTGAAITTHCQHGQQGLAQLDIFASEGMDLSRVIVGHMGCNPDLETHRALARRGAYIGYDRIGQGHEENDDLVAPLVARMVALGYERQMLLSQDTSVFLFGVRRPPLPSHLGGHSVHERPAYDHLWHGFLPRLRLLGVSEAAFHTMLVENPARVLPIVG